MSLIGMDRDLSRSELRWFGLVPAVFLGMLGWMLRTHWDLETASTAVWIAAGVVLFTYYAVARLRRPIFRLWTAAFFPLAWIVSHLMLAAMFYLVFTPVGLLMRLFGKDPLTRRLDRSADTYWVERTSEVPLSRYFRQF